MVKQADGWNSGLTKKAHMRSAEIATEHAAGIRRSYVNPWAIFGDAYATEAEYHEACAEGRTTAAEESDHQ